MNLLLPFLVGGIFSGIDKNLDCGKIENPTLLPNGSYDPIGRVVFKAGMETYETGNLTSETVLIGVYDINGFFPSTNIWQICDKLSEEGYKVILPDFFHGVPWTKEHYPIPKDVEFTEFIQKTSWDESVREDLGKVLAHYKTEGVKRFGIFGFCFGGGISAKASDFYADDIKIAGQFHPVVNISDAYAIKTPTLLLPGANDGDMTEYCDIINSKLGYGACVYHHFRDVNHGFSGGRADWNNGTIRGRAQEAVGMYKKFLCEKFPM